MPRTLIIPKLEMSMREGALAEWRMADSAAGKEGDVIYVTETNNAARDFEAPAAGMLVHKAPAGETYDVGAEIGEFV